MSKIKNKEQEEWHGATVTFMKEIGIRTKCAAMERTYRTMATHTKASFKIAR